MKLKFILTTLLSLTLLLASGCTQGEPGSSKEDLPSNVRTVNTKIESALKEATSSMDSRFVIASDTYNGDGFTFTFEIDYINENSYAFNFIINFNGFSRNGVAINGSLTQVLTFPDSNNTEVYSASLEGTLTGTYSEGDFTIIYKLKGNQAGPNEGGVTFNGTYYPAASYNLN